MQIKITLKDPDGFYEAIRSAAESAASNIDGISESEREDIADNRHEEISEALKTWVKHGEYVTIVFDTDEMTATVLEN